MAEVKIIINGYLDKEAGGRTCPNIILIRDNKLNIIVDPGTVEKTQLMIRVLQRKRISPENIDQVILTHAHIDHFKNLGIFNKAKVREYSGWWENDKFIKANPQITKHINLIKTPGHSSDSLTILVKTDKGMMAICGDVFWKENYPQKDPYATDLKNLLKSRKKVLQLADYIIPGHGKMFKVKKNEK